MPQRVAMKAPDLAAIERVIFRRGAAFTRPFVISRGTEIRIAGFDTRGRVAGVVSVRRDGQARTSRRGLLLANHPGLRLLRRQRVDVIAQVAPRRAVAVRRGAKASLEQIDREPFIPAIGVAEYTPEVMALGALGFAVELDPDLAKEASCAG